MVSIFPILALKDNYIWVIKNKENNQIIIVDPGEAKPVIEYLKKEKVNLSSILVTHHHFDHIGGIEEILNYCEKKQVKVSVYGPANEKIPHCSHPVCEGDLLRWEKFGLELIVLSIPGHTRNHVAFFGNDSVFCGDTLFTGGCGRIFEGSAKQLFKSLLHLSALPDHTQIYCGHEYTEANLRFANAVEPENKSLIERIKRTTYLRNQNIPTVPSSLKLEKQTNPFLRCHLPQIKLKIEQQFGQPFSDSLSVFVALRQWKNSFI